MSEGAEVKPGPNWTPVSNCANGHKSIMWQGGECPCCALIQALKLERGNQKSIFQQLNEKRDANTA